MPRPMLESGCLCFKGSSSREGLWLASFAGLPYFMYGSLLVMMYLLVSAVGRRGDQIGKLCRQVGFGWISIGMLVSAYFGLNRGDAFLQLVHFLPFFVLWGVWITNPQVVVRPFAMLEKLAWWLVMGSAPMCAIALLEYCLKLDSVLPIVKASAPQWVLHWLDENAIYELRSHALFDNPNILSAYPGDYSRLGSGSVVKSVTKGKSRCFSYSDRLADSDRLAGWSDRTLPNCPILFRIA